MNMAENIKDIQNELKQLKWSLDTLFAIQSKVIQANESLITSFILKNCFGIGKGARIKKTRIKVYLAIDGKRTVNDISEVTGTLLPNVSREITPLKEEGLIEVATEDPKGIIYQKTFLDELLDLSAKIGAGSKESLEQFLQ